MTKASASAALLTAFPKRIPNLPNEFQLCRYVSALWQPYQSVRAGQRLWLTFAASVRRARQFRSAAQGFDPTKKPRQCRGLIV
jgi:hypothetical protein